MGRDVPRQHAAEYDTLAVTGYRFDQLAAAFDRVMACRDWKGPIRAVIPAGDRQIVEQAVLWFTRTVPEFVAERDGALFLLITAAGYRAGPYGSADARSRAPQTGELQVG
jgi:hypothetical protein